MKKLINTFMVVVILISVIFATAISAKVTEESLGYKILAESQNKSELITVKDFSVIDGDTSDFILNRTEEPSIKARFLLIDAPEMQIKPYTKEVKNRVRALLKEADHIQIEYEGPTKDKYQRNLVHVWVDGILLQKILVTEGLAIARYINGYLPNSQYFQAIYQAQDYAAKNKLKLWSTGDSEYLSKAEGLSVPYEGEGASGNSSSAGFVRDDAGVSEDVYFRLSI